jgi:hypothetical protein
MLTTLAQLVEFHRKLGKILGCLENALILASKVKRMDKIIKVKDSQVGALLAFYEKEKAAVLKEIKATESVLETLNQKFEDAIAVINTLTDKTPSNGKHAPTSASVIGEFSQELTEINAVYPKGSSWWEKIKWVLKDKAMVLSAGEITDIIYELQPELSDLEQDEKKVTGINIFSTLSNKFKDGKIARIKEGAEYKYGFNEWFDEADILKEEFYNIL